MKFWAFVPSVRRVKNKSEIRFNRMNIVNRLMRLMRLMQLMRCKTKAILPYLGRTAFLVEMSKGYLELT